MLIDEGTLPDREPTDETRLAVASTDTTEQKRPRRHISKQPTPARILRRRVNGRFAAQGSLPSTAPYQYTPLNEDLGEIRLMTLHEGRFTTDIQVSIHTVVLTPENPPIYEALSYVWGSTRSLIDIKVGHEVLAVTTNLAQALSYLRYKDKPRVLWIDSICVDQQGLEERAHQVKRMADLYRLAHRVVGWLGPSNKRSTFGMRILEDLGSKIKIDPVHHNMEPASSDVEKHWTVAYMKLPYDKKELLAIYEVITRPWFRRLWVQQEILLAAHDPILMCGSDLLAWKPFRQAIHCLTAKEYGADHTFLFHEDPLNYVSELHNLTSEKSAWDFIDIMRQTNHCKCLDPRDRIYAILSLLNKSDRALGIEPNYEWRTSQVYLNVALRYIAHHKEINILMSSGLKDMRSEMPSWVPDWTVVNAAWPFDKGGAGGYSKSKVHYFGSGILHITGTHWAAVQHAKKIGFADRESMVANIQRLAPDDILCGSYIGGGSLLAAYCHTICTNHFGDGFLPVDNDMGHSQQNKDFLFAILGSTKQEVLDFSPGTEGDHFWNIAKIMCKERSFIETREGYIGLAPEVVQPGDQVCVFLGCDNPLLLRPAPNSRYQLVGACYIHGLMYGEAFLGPLPDHYQVVSVIDQANGRSSEGFLNHRDGTTQYNDPRFEPSLEDFGDEEHAIRIHPDGSRSRYLTAKVLEKRGVKLRNFEVI